jgi:hypothetical protein
MWLQIDNILYGIGTLGALYLVVGWFAEIAMVTVSAVGQQ